MIWDSHPWSLASLVSLSITLIIVYIHTSSFQGRLEKANRDVRLCGSNAFERETVRFVALSSVSTNRQLYHGVLMTFGVITLAIVLVDMMVQKNTGIPVVIACITIPLVITGYNAFTKKALLVSEVKQYRSALETAEKIFAHTGKTAAWERYRAVLVKRVSRDHNFSSVKDAEDYIANLINNVNYRELVGYVEFEVDRDHGMLKDLAGTIGTPSTRTAIEKAVDKLSLPSTFNPIPAYHQHFRAVYAFIIMGALVCGYLYHRILVHEIGIPYTLGLLACFITISLVYTAWIGWTTPKN